MFYDPDMFYDLIGGLASLLSTYYFIRVDIKAWPIGLIATCINGYLYWKKGIYADMWLELFYFMSICYGWHRWSSFHHHRITTIKHLSNKQWAGISIALVGLFLLIYKLLISHSSSTIPKIDALTTSLSLVAQWLMCHKYLATWVFWLAADALYAGLYWGKDLSFHTIVMITYTGMAIAGYLRWRKTRARLDLMSLAKVTEST